MPEPIEPPLSPDTESSPDPGADATFADLEIPDMRPAHLVKEFGPGLILMMTGIGTSHLITAPVAGGRFEFALLWCIPIAYVFKYYGFEMAFRFTCSTGRSMLDAYATAPAKWPLWYVLVATLVQCVVGQAGRLVAASAVLYYLGLEYFGVEVPMWVFGVGLGILSVFVLLKGRYAALELFAKISAGILVVSSAAVYFARPAPLAAMGHFFIFETPHGSWLTIAAFLGLLPTGIDVSLQASEWGKAKRAGMSLLRERLERGGWTRAFDPFTSPKSDLRVDIGALPPRAYTYCRKWFEIALWDFRHGHVISFVVAVLFLLLAAMWIYPSSVKGQEVIGEIGRIFTESIGPGMMLVFILGSFAATYSTAFNYFDGWPRVVGACCRNLFRVTARLQGIAADELDDERRRRFASEYNIYRATMFFSLVSASAIIAGVPRPVWLVLIASALAFFIAPVIYFLNLYYCFTVIPKEAKGFYPSVFGRWFAWASLVVFTGLSAILVAARIFHIELFGA